jgi:hypothetical protein
MRQATSNLHNKRTRNGQKGAVLVEMAIILPLFALLLLGTFEFGSIARDHQVLQNAAREGARFSSLPANDMNSAGSPANAAAAEAVIKGRIIAYLANENITVGAGDIVVDQGFPVPLGALTVSGSNITITYDRALIFPGITSLIPLGSLQLTGNAVFRNFYY